MTESPPMQRQHAVALGLLPPQLLQLLDLVRVVGRDVVGLREVARAGRRAPSRRRGRGPSRRRGRTAAIVSGERSHGSRSGRDAAHQPSLYMARLPNISKYCVVCRSAAVGVVERVEEAGAVHRLLVDAVDQLGSGMPAASRTVGPTSMHVRELRAHLVARPRAGAATPRPSGRACRRGGWRVCLPHWNGVLQACAQAAATVRRRVDAAERRRCRRTARSARSAARGRARGR